MSIPFAHPALGEIDRIMSRLEVRLRQAGHQLARRADPSAHCQAIAGLLESLPLATEEFAVASSRLEHAMAYFRQGEAGAARFELRLILGTIRALRTRWQ